MRPYTVADETLVRIATLAEELDLPVHIHVHETAEEVADALRTTGCRPLERLDRLGLVSERLIAVHMTQLLDAEIALLAARGAAVVHCPASNLKLACGIAPVARLLQAGVSVALGSDGAASNNRLDVRAEAALAALLAKAQAGDATTLPAWQALECATLNGATRARPREARSARSSRARTPTSPPSTCPVSRTNRVTTSYRNCCTAPAGRTSAMYGWPGGRCWSIASWPVRITPTWKPISFAPRHRGTIRCGKNCVIPVPQKRFTRNKTKQIPPRGRTKGPGRSGHPDYGKVTNEPINESLPWRLAALLELPASPMRRTRRQSRGTCRRAMSSIRKRQCGAQRHGPVLA